MTLFSLLLSGCNPLSGLNPIQKLMRVINGDQARIVNSDQESRLQITNNVLDCINGKNLNNLKSLLCETTRSIQDIDLQILEGFALFGGRIVSFDDHLLGHQGYETDHGKITHLVRYWTVDNIITDNNEVFEIFIHANIINENDKEREGITKIEITRKGDGLKSLIYNRWRGYYYPSRDLSYKIITALSESDFNSLKILFSQNVLEIENIEEQIQSGINFFEGKATGGWLDESKTNYDARLDYRTYVIEDKAALNNKERASIIVFNENIATDAGKIYNIEYYSSWFYKREKVDKEISRINITDAHGNECIIGERIN